MYRQQPSIKKELASGTNDQPGEVSTSDRSELDEFSDSAAFTLVDSASEAAFAIDTEFTVVRWNLAAEELFCYKKSEVIGRHCSSVVQAVYSEGEPLCVSGCEGSHCFRLGEAFASSLCRVHNREQQWISVKLDSVVMHPQAQNAKSKSVIAVIFLRKYPRSDGTTRASHALRIYTLGCFGMALGGCSIATDKWDRRQASTLLKLLVMRLGRPVHRDIIIDTLWPDADEHSGRERLKVTVYALRRALREAEIGANIIETIGETYLLRREAVWVDTEEFENCIDLGSDQQKQGLWDEALQCFLQAQGLYRGDYMEEDIQADWCSEERRRLHELYLDMLAQMAECHAECGDYRKAVSTCRIILVEDPCRESVHRMLMDQLVRSGHADSALDQYHQCQVILARELGVDPMLATQNLYQQILNR